MTKKLLYPLLTLGLIYVIGCAPLSRPSESAEPYALIEFPASIRLLKIDGRPVASRTRVSAFQVSPGQHQFHLAYTAAGADGSTAHDGQVAAPFALDIQEGHTYRLEAKT